MSPGSPPAARTYDGGKHDVVAPIRFVGEGSAYVAVGSGTSPGGSVPEIGAVHKLDTSGDEVWVRRSRSLQAVTGASAGGLFLAGTFDDADQGAQIMLAARMDGDGNLLWKIPGPSRARFGSALFVVDSSKLLVVGVLGREPLDLDPGAAADVVGGPGIAIVRYGF
jgi:hypothetical protein